MPAAPVKQANSTTSAAVSSQPVVNGSPYLYILVGALIILCCCASAVFIPYSIVNGLNGSSAANTSNQPGMPAQAVTPGDGNQNPPVIQALPNRYLYLINCRIYETRGDGFKEITAEIKGYQVPGQCNANPRPIDKPFVLTVGAGQSGYTNYYLDPVAGMAKALDIKVQRGALAYDPNTETIYEYIPTGGVLAATNAMGQRKELVNQPYREVLGRGVSVSDEVAISLSPARDYLLVNDTISTSREKDKKAFSIEIFDIGGKIVYEQIGTKAIWLNKDEIAFIAPEISDVGDLPASAPSTTKKGVYLYRYNIPQKKVSKLMEAVVTSAVDLAETSGKLYLTEYLGETVGYRSKFIDLASTTVEVHTGLHLARAVGDNIVAFNTVKCNLNPVAAEAAGTTAAGATPATETTSPIGRATTKSLFCPVDGPTSYYTSQVVVKLGTELRTIFDFEPQLAY